jgi:hypothetical protein
MKRRAMIGLILAVCLAASFSAAAPERRVQICTWGGTPTAPTGEVTLTPGVNLTPSAEPLKLHATGPLTGGGRCKGTMTFDGVAEAGATCAHTMFDGKVRGLPGVARFRGPGIANLVHEFLYDRNGNIVGADQPVLLLQDDEHSQAEDCATPEGFTHAVFSATVELWG